VKPNSLLTKVLEGLGREFMAVFIRLSHKFLFLINITWPEACIDRRRKEITVYPLTLFEGCEIVLSARFLLMLIYKKTQ